MKQPNRVIRLAAQVLEDEYLDLYVLAATALVFTILGVTGIASVTDLASMILALLTVLALSQVRSRRQIAAISNARRADRFPCSRQSSRRISSSSARLPLTYC